jgi:hypothetical protein
VHPAKERPLRYGPNVDVSVLLRYHGEVFGAAPEVHERVAGRAVVRFGSDRAPNHDVVGRRSEPEDLHVIAEPHVEIVLTGLEEVRVARGAELARLLLQHDGVNSTLNRGHGHRRVEDEHVGAEIGKRARRCVEAAGVMISRRATQTRIVRATGATHCGTRAARGSGAGFATGRATRHGRSSSTATRTCGIRSA